MFMPAPVESPRPLVYSLARMAHSRLLLRVLPSQCKGEGGGTNTFWP
jgi:hypothetical protein